MGKRRLLEIIPLPLIPVPFPQAAQKEDGRQKNGGKKISCFYIFAPIFLPFPLRALLFKFRLRLALPNPRLIGRKQKIPLPALLRRVIFQCGPQNPRSNRQKKS